MEQFIDVFLIVWLWPAIAVGALGVGGYFARRYILGVEHNAEDRAALNALRERVDQLESAWEESQRDVARIDARQEFTTRLLADRVQSPL